MTALPTPSGPRPGRRQPPKKRPAAKRPELVVVPSPERSRRPLPGLILGVGGLVLAGVFAVSALQVLMLDWQRRLDRIESVREDLRDEEQRLRWEVAELESPAQISLRATRDLGMVPAAAAEVVPAAPAAPAPTALVRTAAPVATESTPAGRAGP